MKNQLKDNRVIKRYSEAFKQKVLQSIRQGHYSKNQASLIFGVADGTIYNWIKKYDRTLFNSRIRVENIDEKDQLKSLKQRIDELEKALADSQLQQFKSRAYLEVAAQRLGYSNWEDFEKKHGRQP